MKHPCGCVTGVSSWCGVITSLSKCDHHTRLAGAETRSPRSHYESMGCAVNGIPQCATYIAELMECIDIVPSLGDETCIEMGCGCSMYAPLVSQLGYRYVGVDQCEWAAKWTRSAHCVTVLNCYIEEASMHIERDYAGLIIAAHVLEHLPKPREALSLMHGLLRPGKPLALIVPNDEDLVNPDHFWFFSEKTLKLALETSGFKVDTIQSRRRIAREQFIYVKATKV